MIVDQLPIDSVLPDLQEIFRSRSNCVLHAPPGAGKTTRVPLAMLDLFPAQHGRIIMLEPRRLAAVSAARWMASQIGESVGETVGYSIRFDSKVSALTRIEVVTEAILTRRIQSDPLLEGVAMVIFDEFHERSIHADLGLALCLDLQRQVRNDLRILVMSATLEIQAVSGVLGGAPVISSTGRSYPVQEVYVEDVTHGSLPTRMATVALRALSETEGDLLLFLPGAGEIKACSARLGEAALADRGISVHPLYGDLPFEQQQAALLPGKGRKIVLATSIAETSLTIEGIRTVIDCGMSRRMRHDPASGMNRLVTIRESKSSAEQRKGRAGRLAPGVCYRLFSRHTFSAMTPHSAPELLESDLSPLMLELAAWGVTDPGTLPWIDVPPVAALAVAGDLLRELSALDENGRITSLGSAISELPLHPRLARMLVRSCELGCYSLGCDLAALLSERDIVRRTVTDGSVYAQNLDIEERLFTLQEWRRTGRCDGAIDKNALKNVIMVARQLERFDCRNNKNSAVCEQSESVARLLLVAYPDRIGCSRGTGSGKYLLSNGRGARMARVGLLVDFSFIVAISVNGGDQTEGVIHLASPLDEVLIRDELGHRIVRKNTISWDSRDGRIIAVCEDRLGAICLASKPFIPENATIQALIIDVVRTTGFSLLKLTEDFYQLQARIGLIQAAFPEDGWPDLSEKALLETLDSWLAPMLSGVRNEQQLASVNVTEAVLATFDYKQRQSLETLAPTHLTVPSGSRIRLDYCQGNQPVLAVKLQELFGLAETPTVAQGRVGVVLHLLSPAGRPLQVTQDLHGFWDGSYHQIKKEMKGRYPKHPWPDDPWNAVATRRTKPKGS